MMAESKSSIAASLRTATIAWSGGSLNREALAAAAGALGVGIVEHEARGEIIFAPVHGRSDEVEDGRAVDIEIAAGGFDLLVERLFIGHVIDRISQARAAAFGSRKLCPDRAVGRARHEVGDPIQRRACQDDRRRTGAQFGFPIHSNKPFTAFPILAGPRRSFSTDPMADPTRA